MNDQKKAERKSLYLSQKEERKSLHLSNVFENTSASAEQANTKTVYWLFWTGLASDSFVVLSNHALYGELAFRPQRHISWHESLGWRGRGPVLSRPLLESGGIFYDRHQDGEHLFNSFFSATWPQDEHHTACHHLHYVVLEHEEAWALTALTAITIAGKKNADALMNWEPRLNVWTVESEYVKSGLCPYCREKFNACESHRDAFRHFNTPVA